METTQKMIKEKLKILCVDDEPDIVGTLRRMFYKEYDVVTSTSGKEAVELIKMQPFDLIISDQRMPEVTGDEVLKCAMETQPEAIRILLTGYSDIASLVKCINDASIYKYMIKPWEPDDLRLTVTRAFEHQREVLEHQRTNVILRQTVQAYERFVPKQFLHLLNINSIIDVKLGDQAERKMTILFSDIRNFTTLSESMTPRENFDFINSYLGWMEPVIEQYHGFIDKYIGDAVMALFPTNADDALNGAIAMQRQLLAYNKHHAQIGQSPLRIGIGINTGMVMLGTIGGEKRMDGTVIGDTVNLSAHLEGLTKTYNTPLLLSDHTLYSLNEPSKFHIRFIDRIHVKGRSAAVAVYEVFDNDEPSLKQRKSATKNKFEQALAFYHMRDKQQALSLLKECQAVAPDDQVVQIYIERCNLPFTSDMVELGCAILWSEDFLVGLPELDLLHTELLSAMNQFMDALSGEGRDEIFQAIEMVRKRSDALFRAEDALMLSLAYPMQEYHQQEHLKFNEYFAEFTDQLIIKKQEVTVLRFRAQMILLDWFANHTTHFDCHLVQYLHDISSTSS